MTLRHELKHWIPWRTYHRLRQQLKVLMASDSHGSEYHIRSLYFDTPQGDDAFEKYSGLLLRNKYRMRFYNHSDDVIKLEIKSRIKNKIRKRSTAINREYADMLLSTRIPPTTWSSTGDVSVSAKPEQEEPKRAFIGALKQGKRLPTIIVDYVREAYVYKYGNVRITFDKNLRGAFPRGNIFSRDLPTFPIHSQHAMILEVKFDSYLPKHIAQIIQPMLAGATDISKYCLCRSLLFSGEELL